MKTDRVSNLIRPKDLPAEIGISRETARRWILAGKFPPKVRLSRKTTGWWRKDIEAWRRQHGELAGNSV